VSQELTENESIPDFLLLSMKNRDFLLLATLILSLVGLLVKDFVDEIRKYSNVEPLYSENVNSLDRIFDFRFNVILI
jgi:hypothetical protein